jgi:hypothetical protein
MSDILEDLIHIDHYLMGAEVKRLSPNKWEAQNFDTERFNPKRLNDVEVQERYKIKI